MNIRLDVNSRNIDNIQMRPKQGDVRDDGKIFWSIIKGKEYWVTAERFKIRKTKCKEASLRYRLTEHGSAKFKARHILNKANGVKPSKVNPEKRAVWMEKYMKSEKYRELVKKQSIRKRGLGPDSASRKNQLAYERRKSKTDPIYNISQRCRRRIRTCLKKSERENAKSVEIIGCSYGELMAHLEKQFTEGMNWENRSKWHIDHIVPLASAKSTEEVIALCHFSNLRPLWAFDNLSKGSKQKYEIKKH